MTAASPHFAPTRIALATLLAVLLAAGLIPLAYRAEAEPTASASSRENVGNPFENGDFTWDSNTQTYRLAGVGIRVGDIRESGRPGNAGPFAYPRCLSEAYALYQQGSGGGNFEGWGVSTFSYGYANVTRNTRNLSFGALPNWGWCAQVSNDTTIPDERDARLILIEEQSWWDEGGGIYHACFALLVDNGHEHGIWDQATIGGDYVRADWKVSGRAGLVKESGNPGISEGNASYSLEGAAYGVYASREDAHARENAVATLRTDAEGRAESGDLNPGTYFVREVQASRGYALDEQIHELPVKAGETASLHVEDLPQCNPIDILLEKADAETGDAVPQGSATLAGAVFEVRYYDGAYASVEAAEASGSPTRTWTVRTDDQGRARLDEASVVGGDALYRNSEGSPVMPLGTVLIRETQAPEGYLLPDPAPVERRVIDGTGIVETVLRYNAPRFSDQGIRGGVSIEKRDAETGGDALGNATLDGAVFRIYNRSEHAVMIEGRSVEPGGRVADIVSSDGVAATRADLLPYGSYSVEEAVAPDGYLGTSVQLRFSIEENGTMVELAGDDAFSNLVKRGDLAFRKKDGASGSALAGVPFRITSRTTGESHIIVTDANGYASTASDWNPHSRRTNANDEAVDGAFDAEAGVWFGGAGNGAGAPVDDARGALPYDAYDVEELPCAANEGLQLVMQENIVVTRDARCIDLGTIDDPRASVGTTARDASDGDHLVAASAEARVIDRVAYAGLIPGRSYTVAGTLVDRQTGAPLDFGAGPLAAETTFTPTQPNGTAEVAFDLSSSVNLLPADGWDGIEAAVFEELSCDGRVIARHEDVEDTAQRILIVPPSVRTEAVDGADGDKEVAADPEATATDTLAYEHLVPNASYTAVSALFARDSAEGAAPDDAEGAAASARTEFQASADGSGTVAISLPFDASAVGDGTAFVAMEWIYDEEGNLVAAHADAEDAAQTVTVRRPTLATAASDPLDGDKTVADDGSERIPLADRVDYEGLVPGKTYVLSTTLANAATGSLIADDEGEPVSATLEFSPERSSGTIRRSSSSTLRPCPTDPKRWCSNRSPASASKWHRMPMRTIRRRRSAWRNRASPRRHATAPTTINPFCAAGKPSSATT